MAEALGAWDFVDPIHALQSFFILASCTVLLVNALPAFRGRFVAYGPRTSSPEKSTDAVSQSNTFEKVLDNIASWRVPHHYFLHFYVVSVSSSLFWGQQLVRRGPAFMTIASRVHTLEDTRSMTSGQLILCWFLMAIQGTRRLYESIALTKRSESKMWFIHWILGIGFYVVMGISIWVEGIPTLKSSENLISDASIGPPSLRTCLCLSVFLIASGIQRDCHCYLASLEKYTLPTNPAFQRIVCPHYTAECAIYASLTVIAAPPGEVVNTTILAGLVFVVVNLGVSAQISKDWYEGKFGRESMQNRWRMIPFIY